MAQGKQPSNQLEDQNNGIDRIDPQGMNSHRYEKRQGKTSQEGTQERTTTQGNRWRNLNSNLDYYGTGIEDKLWINIETGVAQELAQKEAKKTENKNSRRNDTLRTHELPQCL